jgi:hypothetical protein
MTTTPETAPTVEPAAPGRRRWIGRAGVLLFALSMVAFWIWALFFASKEAINKIEDRAWAARAETICLAATDTRGELMDLRRVDPTDLAQMNERAALVDRATDVLETMLDDVTAVSPADEKGQAIVPLWEEEYRQYLQNRRDFAEALRRGENIPFRETEVGGIPISERLETFAVDNEMPACKPPRDLSM